MQFDHNPLVIPAKTVCVTGAGGFIASWLVQLLLEKGYTVKGTVRDPEDEKNAHLRELKGAKERLILCKAHLLDFDGLKNAIRGCDGVFHIASPMMDDPQMVGPAIKGARYVVMAAAEAKVRRVVFTSSIGAVYMNPDRSPEAVLDEQCWSDLDFLKKTNNWYCYGKLLAEKAALDLAKEIGVDLVSLVPVMVVGPALHSSMDRSIKHIIKYLDGSAKTYANAVHAYMTVQDVAKAHLLVYETSSASGRYICGETMLHRGDIAKILADFFPQYPIPTKCSDEKNPRKKFFNLSNKKIKDLGMEFASVREALYEMVKSLQQKGHLPFHIHSNL